MPQRLYFRPDPHGQGSFRPSSDLEARPPSELLFDWFDIFSAPSRISLKLFCSFVILIPPTLGNICVMFAIKFASSSLNILKPSRLYSINGSRWP